MKREMAFILAAPLLILALAGSFCRGSREPEPAPKAGPARPELKITQFYASPSVVARGEQALVCYGVEDARSVSIAPGVEPLAPSVSRCVPVTPVRTTRYTLTAEGLDGRTASATVTVEVRPGAAPAPAVKAPAPESLGPLIAYFRTEKKPGLTLLCYEVSGAEAVAIEPGVLARSAALRGCLGVAPSQPTTYTLTAFGTGKTAHRTLTVSPE